MRLPQVHILFILLFACALVLSAQTPPDAPLPKGPGPLYGCTCPWSCIGYKIMHMVGLSSVAPMQMN